MPNVAELAAQIQQLTTAEKHELLCHVFTDSDEPEQDADEVWRAEIVKRVKAIHNGEAALRALQEE